jgi:integrase
MKLTKAVVESLELPAGKKDYIAFDDTLPGFGVRIRAGGKRSYVVQYRSGHQQRRESLGDVRAVDIDEARRAAKRRLGAVALGHDPAAEKAEARRRSRLTLGSLVPRFLERKRAEVRPGTFRNVTRFVRYLEPLYERPIHEIERRDVAELVNGIQDRHSADVARTVRIALGDIYTWLMGEGIAATNPVIGTNVPPTSKARDRVLTDAELAAIWRNAGGGEYGQIIRLLILTACRRDEIGGMHWDELKGTIFHDDTIFHAPGSRIKNDRDLILPLPPLALAILEEVPCCRLNHGRRVFGKRAGGFSGWAASKRLLDERLAAAGHALQPWQLRDVRRSVATCMADIGIAPHVIETILNHISGHKGGVAGIYNLSRYGPEVRSAMLQWADHVLAIVGGRPQKVVPLRGRA